MKSSMTRSGIEPVDHNASTTRAIQAAHHWRNLVREKQEQDQNKEEDPIRCGRSLGHLVAVLPAFRNASPMAVQTAKL